MAHKRISDFFGKPQQNKKRCIRELEEADLQPSPIAPEQTTETALPDCLASIFQDGRSFNASGITKWRRLHYIEDSDRVVCFSCVKAVEKGLINEECTVRQLFCQGRLHKLTESHRKNQGA